MHRAFQIGVILKGIHGLVEIVTAVAILALNPSAVSEFFLRLAERELKPASHDFLASLLVGAAANVSAESQHFAEIYLAAHGAIDLALVIGLLAGALWAYPAALGGIAAFMAYQLYRYTETGGVILIGLMILDTVVWWLVWREYVRVRRGAGHALGEGAARGA